MHQSTKLAPAAALVRHRLVRLRGNLFKQVFERTGRQPAAVLFCQVSHYRVRFPGAGLPVRENGRVEARQAIVDQRVADQVKHVALAGGVVQNVVEFETLRLDAHVGRQLHQDVSAAID